LVFLYIIWFFKLYFFSFFNFLVFFSPWDGPIKVFHSVLSSLSSVQLKKVEMKNIFSETSQFFLLVFIFHLSYFFLIESFCIRFNNLQPLFLFTSTLFFFIQVLFWFGSFYFLFSKPRHFFSPQLYYFHPNLFFFM
jgi:hypothetical protein